MSSPRLGTVVLVACLGSVVLLTSSAVRADGLLVRADQLPSAYRTEMRREIAAARAAEPEAFEAVRRVRGHRPETYRRFRNPRPALGPELRRLGPRALLPMLEVLAFEAPAHEALSAEEQQALIVGLIEAVGVLRDRRSGPVLRAAFLNARPGPVAQVAAEAAGRLCDEPSRAWLKRHSEARGSMQLAAIRGLGHCRRLDSAQQLTHLLEHAPDPEQVKTIAEALGTIGSSWAWRAKGPSHAARGTAVRELAARALVRVFFEHAGPARTAAGRALTMVEYADTRELAQAHGPVVDAKARARLDRIVARIERRVRALRRAGSE